MISRTYTVNEGQEDIPLRCYKGFNRAYQPLHKLERVAVIFVGGEIELYALDPGIGSRTEFIRYLTDEQERGFMFNVQIAGIYDRTKN